MKHTDDLLEFVKNLAKEGISTTITFDGEKFFAEFKDGFYKSDGCSYLEQREEGIVLNSRYGGVTEVETVEDVVRNSYNWYKSSKDRFDGWAFPPRHWEKLYEQYDLTN